MRQEASPLTENSLTSELVTGEPAWVCWTAARRGAVVVAGCRLAGCGARAGRSRRATSSGQPLESRQSPFPDPGADHADERRAVHAPLDRPSGRDDSHGARCVGRIETGAAFVERHDRDQRRRRSRSRCHGHRKRDAVEIKALIERYQTDYYRGPGGACLQRGRRPVRSGR